MDKNKKNYNVQKEDEKKKNNKKWLLLLLLLLFLCLFGYFVFRIGFSVGEKHKPVTVDPTPQKMLIKITDTNGEWGNGKTKQVKIETNPSKLSLEFNESYTVFALTTSKDPIIWTSSDESCVTVSPKEGQKPTITAGDKECTAVVTAKTGGVKSDITVTVVKKHDKLKKIELKHSNYVVNIGESILAAITVAPTTAEIPKLIYKIKDSSIATVDENGVITGISEGKTTLIVTTADEKYTIKASVTVNKVPVNDDDTNEINIFSVSTSSREYIAPYDSGVYEFDVKNTISKNILYKLNLEEENEDRVNIKYKLKKNGTYIISDWVYYEQIKLEDVALAAKQTDIYELEWCWVSENNELDTQIGLKKERAKYTITINVIAMQDVER